MASLLDTARALGTGQATGDEVANFVESIVAVVESARGSLGGGGGEPGSTSGDASQASAALTATEALATLLSQSGGQVTGSKQWCRLLWRPLALHP